MCRFYFTHTHTQVITSTTIHFETIIGTMPRPLSSANLLHPAAQSVLVPFKGYLSVGSLCLLCLDFVSTCFEDFCKHIHYEQRDDWHKCFLSVKLLSAWDWHCISNHCCERIRISRWWSICDYMVWPHGELCMVAMWWLSVDHWLLTRISYLRLIMIVVVCVDLTSLGCHKLPSHTQQ